jgi:hypothetical protein
MARSLRTGIPGTQAFARWRALPLAPLGSSTAAVFGLQSLKTNCRVAAIRMRNSSTTMTIGVPGLIARSSA